MLLTTSFPFEGQEEDGGDDQRAARPADGRKVFMQRCIEVQSHPYKLITYCFYIFIVVQRRPEETQLTACILLFCRYIRGYPFMECPHTARNQPCEMTGIIQ